MKDKGERELEVYNHNEDYFGEFNPYSPCKTHPSSSLISGGICAYCLSDRLDQLVCPGCGVKRLSCCCCSEFISNSNTITDVGKISSLLENEKCLKNSKSKSKSKTEQKSSPINDDITNLKTSKRISKLVDASNRRKSEIVKFWKLGRLFRKKGDHHKINQSTDEKYESSKGVSKSRSVSSFKGFYDTEESGGFPVISSAARASSVSTENFFLDSAKRSCFSESEARISNFDYCDGFFNGPNKHNIFSLQESEFMSSDDPGFIDLKLNESMSSDHSKSSLPLPLSPSLAALRRGGLGLSTKEFGFRGGEVMGREMFNNGGGSCRISNVSESELRKYKKSSKVWRWIFRQHTSASNNFTDHI